MQANISNGIFCIMESKKNGNDLICYLEATDNISQDVQKNARSTANPKSYPFDYKQHGSFSSSNAILFFV